MADEPKQIGDLQLVTTISPDDLLLTETSAGTAIITFANFLTAVATSEDASLRTQVDELTANFATLAAVQAAHADRLAALEGGV